uniref:Uncharacterized protein n=1 Tax=Romanomermis culicivorax TaxID=13658 RepID=A0A915L0R4_ROMCU
MVDDDDDNAASINATLPHSGKFLGISIKFSDAEQLTRPEILKQRQTIVGQSRLSIDRNIKKTRKNCNFLAKKYLKISKNEQKKKINNFHPTKTEI